MTDKCTHGWTTPPECPSCMAMELDALRDSDIQLHARNEMLFSELESLRQENSRLREALATWLKWWDHEVSGTEKGRIYRWTEELLNPPKRS